MLCSLLSLKEIGFGVFSAYSEYAYFGFLVRVSLVKRRFSRSLESLIQSSELLKCTRKGQAVLDEFD